MCPNPKLRIDVRRIFPPLQVRCYDSSVDGEAEDVGTDVGTAAEDSIFGDLSSVDDIISAPASPSGAFLEHLLTHGLAACAPVRLLGTGATCRVDLVHVPLPDGAPPLAAARKVLPRSKDPHLRSKEDLMFHRELEGLRAGLGCPFIVRMLATATHPDRHELLMELAEGNTLEHELSSALSSVRGELRQPLLSPTRLAEVATSVLSALAALHRQGLAHLDIKPANVLLTAEGRVLLGDAGCAQWAAPDGLLTAPASGTPLFAAPEVKRKGAACSVKADVFSAGVMLAVCAAWHRQTGRVLGFLRGEVPLPEHVPAGFRDLVARMVAADPAQRPSAEEALAHPFLAEVDVAALAPRRSLGCAPR